MLILCKSLRDLETNNIPFCLSFCPSSALRLPLHSLRALKGLWLPNNRPESGVVVRALFILPFCTKYIIFDYEIQTIRLNLSVTKIEHLSRIQFSCVIPAKAGIQAERALFNWMDCYVLVTLIKFWCSPATTLIIN